MNNINKIIAMNGIDSPTVDDFNALFTQACEDHQNKRFQGAVKGYQQLIHYFSDAPILHYNLGLLFLETEQYTQAVASFQIAEQLHPEDADIVFNLALSYKKKGELSSATDTYKKVLLLEPQSLDALYNLAGCYRDQGQYDFAVAMYREVLEIDAEHLAATNNLAYVYQRQGDLDKAILFYRQVLRLDPKHSAASHMLASLTGAEVSASPKEYVQGVFDSYSAHYEKSLVEELEYAVPEKIRQIVLTHTSWAKGFSRGVDLGCGTGLSGEALKGVVRCIDGVDLSPKMVEIAKAKNVYESLYVSGINEFLENDVGPYDFVLAADVFGYIGDLQETFVRLHRKTEERVLFCFSTELSEGQGFTLRTSGRFAHSTGYIEKIAQKTGWMVCEHRGCALRKEKGQPIEGNLWFMEKGEL